MSKLLEGNSQAQNIKYQVQSITLPLGTFLFTKAER